MTTYTPRLGLTVPSVDDTMSSLPENWDRLENTFNGAVWTPPGTMPDEVTLFDGAIVAETGGSGIIWQATKDQFGAWTKRYLKYPWCISVYVDYTSTVMNVWTDVALTTEQPTRGFNTKPENFVGGNIVLPVKGEYGWSVYYRFDPATPGVRGLTLVSNGSQSHLTHEHLRSNVDEASSVGRGGQCKGTMRGTDIWDAGLTLCPSIWRQNGGPASLGVHIRMMVCLIRPL